MEIKFRKKLTDYKWLVMFDLASKNSGVCVWDISANRPIMSKTLKAKGDDSNRSIALWEELQSFFLNFNETIGSLEDVVVHRELCPLQQGKFTTAKTLIALGKAHAVLDLFLATKDIDYYDTNGVSPSTTHAYFRRINCIPAGEKVDKEDVRSYLVETYGIDPKTGLDETDAMFLAKTFVDVFWDKEIDERVKELKKHARSLKMKTAIEATMNEVSRLTSLKRGG